MSGNDLFFAGLQGVVEIVRQDDAARNELAIAERGAELRRQIHQHQTGANIVGGTLDLSEAMHGGGMDAGNQAKVEQEEADVGPLSKQLLTAGRGDWPSRRRDSSADSCLGSRGRGPQESSAPPVRDRARNGIRSRRS